MLTGMALDVTKGGRGKKAPYESTHCRIPTAIKPLVEKITLAYKQVAGLPVLEAATLKSIEDAIARAVYPGEEKPVNTFKPSAEVGKELVREYLQSLGLDEVPVDEKGKPKARYDQLAKFASWLEAK